MICLINSYFASLILNIATAMKNYYLILLSCLTILVSCNSTEKKTDQSNSDSIEQETDSAALQSITPQPGEKAVYAEIIKIDYQKNKEILDILPLLPDSAMASWQWSKEEREGMVRSLAANNQFTDTTKDYNTITKVTPNYLSTSVVDGYWTAALYKVSENHYIVVTNDVVGDGNQIYAYEVQDQQISAVNWSQMIGKKPGDFLLKNSSAQCKKALYEDEEGDQEIGMFSYDFADPNLLNISCYYLNKLISLTSLQCNPIQFRWQLLLRVLYLQAILYLG